MSTRIVPTFRCSMIGVGPPRRSAVAKARAASKAAHDPDGEGSHERGGRAEYGVEDADAVAGRAVHYISPRHLQKLFEAEGSTVTDWIRRRRLDHCRRELLDPRNAGEPISRITARWGLLDSSHFSRLFRANGMSPREFRSEGVVSA
jgi:Helix-turn-helix domain